MIINTTAIYVLWLREMKRFIRAKSRIIGTIATPLLFMVFLGIGFTKISIPGMQNINYINFLVPGIVAMGIIFSSTFAGMSVLWDREFGFLKEIMVTPVNRISIMLGRVAGGVTVSLIQGIAILIISLAIGFEVVGILPFLLSIVFMLLIATTFIGLGLVLASKMRDMQGFGLIINFIIFPLFFLSGAIFPIENLPSAVKYICYANPLTYGVDGLRGLLAGISTLSVVTDFFVLVALSLGMILLGAYLFSKSEAV